MGLCGRVTYTVNKYTTKKAHPRSCDHIATTTPQAVLAAPLKKKMAIAPPTQRVALTANTRETKYKPPQSQPEVAITKRSIGSLPIVITHLPEVCNPITKTNNQV